MSRRPFSDDGDLPGQRAFKRPKTVQPPGNAVYGTNVYQSSGRRNTPGFAFRSGSVAGPRAATPIGQPPTRSSRGQSMMPFNSRLSRSSGTPSDPISIHDADDEQPRRSSTRSRSVFRSRLHTSIKQERDQSEHRRSSSISASSSQRSRSSQGFPATQSSQHTRYSQTPRSSLSYSTSPLAESSAPALPSQSRHHRRLPATISLVSSDDSDDDDDDDDASVKQEDDLENVSTQNLLIDVAAADLTGEQQAIVEAALPGDRNIFYTGSAGSGKSTVLIELRRLYRLKGKRVVTVASTGRAALNVGGMTIHSYAGWDINSHKKAISELELDAKKGARRTRFVDTDVLIIDEISMVSAFTFMRLDRMMRSARGNDRAFGGVQLIVAGDFCQLPPVLPFETCFYCGYEMEVVSRDEEYFCDEHGSFFDKDKWAFRSTAWDEANFLCFNLKAIHRQQDRAFQSILENLRLSPSVPREEVELLRNHQHNTRGATKIFPTHEEAKAVNNARLRSLPGRSVSYNCLDYWKWNPRHAKLRYKGEEFPNGTLKALKDHRYDIRLDLKVGMRVMLMVNLDLKKGLVNGSQGTIVRFADHDANKVPKSRNQVESAFPNSDDVQERNATDGAKSLGGQYTLLQYSEVMEFIARDDNVSKCWPVVKFDRVEKEVIVHANCWVQALGDEPPYSLLARTQIPLMAAWAMTVHKSQGMTIDKLIVDVSRCWVQGQAYTALSRAPRLEGLKVEGIPEDWSGGGCNPEVYEFYKTTFPALGLE